MTISGNLAFKTVKKRGGGGGGRMLHLNFQQICRAFLNVPATSISKSKQDK